MTLWQALHERFVPPGGHAESHQFGRAAVRFSPLPALQKCNICHMYLSSAWNKLDGFIVTVSVIDTILTYATAGGGANLSMLRILRIFRIFGCVFGVYGLWFMVYGLWFMVYGLWFMVSISPHPQGSASPAHRVTCQGRAHRHHHAAVSHGAHDEHDEHCNRRVCHIWDSGGAVVWRELALLQVEFTNPKPQTPNHKS